MEDKLITLAIHTYDRAIEVKKILEHHGVKVVMEKLIASGSHIASAMRLRIHENDVSLALKIIESGEYSPTFDIDASLAGRGKTLLIPVDFKPYSLLSCRMGFELAKRLSLHPVLLNAYTTPYFKGSLTDDDIFEGGYDISMEDELAEVEIGSSLFRDSKVRMSELKRRIEDEQHKGNIANVRFSTQISEGVPEDVIKDFCKTNPPALVVMATRGKERKGEELIGSVTAEVLDSCKVPLFSIPEIGHFEKLENIRRLVFFCNLDQHDILSMDTLMRMFDYPEIDVTLIPVNERAGKNLQQKTDSLKDYFNKTYPTAHFYSTVFNHKTFLSDFNKFEESAKIDMILVSNRHRNIFARLLNPGIAHRLLFERDLPLLALPV